MTNGIFVGFSPAAGGQQVATPTGKVAGTDSNLFSALLTLLSGAATAKPGDVSEDVAALAKTLPAAANGVPAKAVASGGVSFSQDVAAGTTGSQLLTGDTLAALTTETVTFARASFGDAPVNSAEPVSFTPGDARAVATGFAPAAAIPTDPTRDKANKLADKVVSTMAGAVSAPSATAKPKSVVEGIVALAAALLGVKAPDSSAAPVSGTGSAATVFTKAAPVAEAVDVAPATVTAPAASVEATIVANPDLTDPTAVVAALAESLVALDTSLQGGKPVDAALEHKVNTAVTALARLLGVELPVETTAPAEALAAARPTVAPFTSGVTFDPLKALELADRTVASRDVNAGTDDAGGALLSGSATVSADAAGGPVSASSILPVANVNEAVAADLAPAVAVIPAPVSDKPSTPTPSVPQTPVTTPQVPSALAQVLVGAPVVEAELPVQLAGYVAPTAPKALPTELTGLLPDEIVDEAPVRGESALTAILDTFPAAPAVEAVVADSPILPVADVAIEVAPVLVANRPAAPKAADEVAADLFPRPVAANGNVPVLEAVVVDTPALPAAHVAAEDASLQVARPMAPPVADDLFPRPVVAKGQPEVAKVAALVEDLPTRVAGSSDLEVPVDPVVKAQVVGNILPEAVARVANTASLLAGISAEPVAAVAAAPLANATLRPELATDVRELPASGETAAKVADDIKTPAQVAVSPVAQYVPSPADPLAEIPAVAAIAELAPAGNVVAKLPEAAIAAAPDAAPLRFAAAEPVIEAEAAPIALRPASAINTPSATEPAPLASAPEAAETVKPAPMPEALKAVIVELTDKIREIAEKVQPTAPALAEKLVAIADDLASGKMAPDVLQRLGIALDRKLADPAVSAAIAALVAPTGDAKAAPAPQPFTPAELALPGIGAMPRKDKVAEAPTAPAKPELLAPAPTPAVEPKQDTPDAKFRAVAEGEPEKLDVAPKQQRPDAEAIAKPAPVAAVAGKVDGTADPLLQPVHQPLVAGVAAAARAMHAAYHAPVQQLNVPQVAFEMVRQFQSGNSRFQIRLDPPELGRIDVKMDVDSSGNVSARLVVDRAETLDLMQRDQRSLERALAQAGLDQGKTNLEFSLRQNPFSGDGQQQGHDQGRPGWHAPRGGETDEPQVAADTMLYRGTVSDSGVNLFV